MQNAVSHKAVILIRVAFECLVASDSFFTSENQDMFNASQTRNPSKSQTRKS